MGISPMEMTEGITMTERRRPRAVFLVLVCMILVMCRPTLARQGDTPPMTDAAMERFADDLSLSEAQEQFLHDLVENYRATYHEETEKYSEDRKVWTRQHYLNAMPELDPSYDISDRPRHELGEILRARRFFGMGFNPPNVLSRPQLEELNNHVHQMSVDFDLLEVKWRDEKLAALREVLAPGQSERWPVAIRRLDINIIDQKTGGKGVPNDPRRRVDMLAMLMAATEADGGELHDYEDALRYPDQVLALETTNQGMIDLAQRVLAFELSYRRALQAYTQERDEHNIKFITHFNYGEMEIAAKHEQTILDARRRIWNVRLRFAEDIAALAGELLGEEAARAWLRRCHDRFCPTLYLQESTDMLFEKILALEDLDEEQLKAMREIYERHDAWREEFRPRVVRLEIEEICTALQSNPEDERGAMKRLLEAHQTRIDRAKQVNQQLRALLSPELQATFDEWFKAWREQHDRIEYAPPINVRP